MANKNYYQNEDGIKLVVLYFFSLLVYWFFFCLYRVKEKMKKESSCIIAIIFSTLVLFLSLINVFNKPILFLPMMYMIAILGVSIYWEFLRK